MGNKRAGPQTAVVAAFTGEDSPRVGSPSSAWDGIRVELVHPRTGAPAPFMVVAGRLCEANLFRLPHAAWLAGERVLNDGGLVLVTPVDPLFLALPLLEAARRQTGDAPAGVFCSLEQALQCERCPETARLAALLAGDCRGSEHGPQTLPEAICEVLEVEGERFYRVHDARVLAWLRCKVARAIAALRGGGGSAFSGMDDAGLAAYAAGLLGEWLAPAWQRRLAAACGLPASGEEQTKALQPLNGPLPGDTNERPEKRPRVDAKELARRQAAEARAETKKAQLARDCSGMRSIASFFGAPKKKG